MNRSTLRLLNFAGVLCIALSNLTAAALPLTGPMTYTEIGDQLISAHGVIEQKPTKPMTYEEKEKQEKEVKLEIAPLSQVDRQKIVFGALAESPDTFITPDTQKEYIYQAQRLLVSDLELFCSRDEQNRGNTLFAAIDNTKTVFGQAALANILAHPTDDVAVLQGRQELIKELINNPELFNELEKLILQVKKEESNIFSFWQEPNKATRDLFDTLYFKWLPNGLNRHAAIHEVGTRLGNLGHVYQTVGDVVAGAALQYALINKYEIGFFKYAHQFMHNSQDFSFTSLLGHGFKEAFFPISNIKRALDLYTNPESHDFITQQLGLSSGTAATIAGSLAGLQAFAMAMRFYTLKQVYGQASMVKNANNHLQTRLIGVATLVNGAYHINTLARKNPVIANGLSSYPATNTLINNLKTRSNNFACLVKLLRTNTFKGKASFFSYTGRVLAAHKLIASTKDQLTGFMTLVGELDACLSIAQLYKKFANERVRYSFVNYINTDPGAHEIATLVPHFKLTEFWNPMVDPKVVVTNDLEMGGHDGMRNMVLTGANTGGKSTLLKAIMTSMLFAHTIGIVPAGEASLTPFHYLAGSLNIIDNAGRGDSLYQAEVKRTAMIIKGAQQATKAGKPSFIIMDELFRGTRPEKADLETYECGKRLAGMDMVSFILATHFLNNPVKLEAETNGVCKNYKVDAYAQPDGSIVRPYKLELGITTSNIASEILNAALDGDEGKGN